ncbi:hypothetical protein LguiA_006742 [Lonicera macranthoides]
MWGSVESQPKLASIKPAKSVHYTAKPVHHNTFVPHNFRPISKTILSFSHTLIEGDIPYDALLIFVGESSPSSSLSMSSGSEFIPATSTLKLPKMKKKRLSLTKQTKATKVVLREAKVLARGSKSKRQASSLDPDEYQWKPLQADQKKR